MKDGRLASSSLVFPQRCLAPMLSRLKRWMTRGKGAIAIEKTERRGTARWVLLFGGEDAVRCKVKVPMRGQRRSGAGEKVGLGDCVDQSDHRRH